MTYTRLTQNPNTIISYKGAAKNVSTDMNNFRSTGIYDLDGTTMSNAPSAYTWGYLIVIAFGATPIQLVIKNQSLATRAYTGSPPAWSAWKSAMFT